MGASELAPVIATTGLTVDAARAGFTLRNVNLALQGGTLTFNATGAVQRSIVAGTFAGSVIALNGTTAAVIQESRIIANTGTAFGVVIQVNTAASASNLIAANTIISESANDNILLFYNGANAITDRVTTNVFIGNRGAAASPVVLVGSGVQGLSFERNTLQDPDSGQFGLALGSGVQNIDVVDNVFRLTGASGTNAITVVGGGAGTTNVDFLSNRISTNGTGTGLRVVSNAGTLTSRVEGNDFHSNRVGVLFQQTNATDPLLDVDLGGGGQGSRGGNNFRSFTAPANATIGAIVQDKPFTTAQTVFARFNLFAGSVPDPEAVIFDTSEPGAGGAANVDASGNLPGSTGAAGNAAFVQALYTEFLHRVESPAGVNFYANRLNGGASLRSVANELVRSDEAMILVVNGLYHKYFGRTADPGGLSFFLNHFRTGGTLEQATAMFLNADEYRLRYGSDGAYMQSLYTLVLGRVATPAEVAAGVSLLRSIGRSATVNAFLGSFEYRANEVARYYAQFLNRQGPLGTAEVSFWVNSGKDLLTIQVELAGSDEFKLNG